MPPTIKEWEGCWDLAVAWWGGGYQSLHSSGELAADIYLTQKISVKLLWVRCFPTERPKAVLKTELPIFRMPPWGRGAFVLVVTT